MDMKCMEWDDVLFLPTSVLLIRKSMGLMSTHFFMQSPIHHYLYSWRKIIMALAFLIARLEWWRSAFIDNHSNSRPSCILVIKSMVYFTNFPPNLVEVRIHSTQISGHILRMSFFTCKHAKTCVVWDKKDLINLFLLIGQYKLTLTYQ